VNSYGTTLLWLTVVVAVLVTVVAIALLRFITAARAAKQHVRDGGTERALLSSALQDAVSRLADQQRAMTARAAASEQLGAQVFDSLTAGLIVVDVNGRVQIANPAATRMLSLAPDASGKAYQEALASAPPLAAAVAEGLSATRPLVRRAVDLEVNGRVWHLGVTVSPLGDPESAHGAICLFSDLTPVVELEQQLRLKEALARLGELTAGIAHEFRNGLATIHGYSRLIDPAAIPERFRPCVEGIRQETDTLGHIVTNFLNFARPEQVMFSSLSMEQIVGKVAADLRAELGDHVAVDVTGAFGHVDGDEIMLRQLFANLIRNAAEACETTDISPCIAIEGRVDAELGVSRISVSDNGPGIPEGDRQRIFQPFFTTRSRGSGLGLPIVQKIALLHNGTVAVGASSGGGGRIELVLPLATAS